MEDNKWHWQEQGTAWKGVGIYHVTLIVPSREPLLGELIIPDNNPTNAYVKETPLAKQVVSSLLHLYEFYPEVLILQFCVMPDHIHAVIHIRRPMKQGIRSVMRSFWQGVKKYGRQYSLSCSSLADGLNSPIDPNIIRDKERTLPNTILDKERTLSNTILDKERTLPNTIQDNEQTLPEPIFTERPFIRSLTRRGQLQTMIRYVQMNPERLATKHLMPDYFRVQEGIEIAGRMYCGVGNAELLQRAKYMPVHVRRTMVDEAEHGDNKRLRDYMNGCVIAARKGVVMVSPFISPKEKEVMEVLLKEGLPFIYIADNGFRDYYKPQDSLFDAVARKQVLILSPWEYDPNKNHVCRAECIEMNKMAEEICASGLTNEEN